MKNKKLLIGLIALCLCLCVLIPLGLRLMWCKVTFICKDGCEHIVWYKWGESANADIVRDAHKDEYPGYVVGPLYMYDELLVNYLGEPLRTPYRTLYVDEWKKPNTFYKVTFDTPYGTLFYLLDYTGLEELQERIPAALVALGGKKNAEYIYYLTYNNHVREDKCSSLSSVVWSIQEYIVPSPACAIAYTDMYTEEAKYTFFVRVVPVEN